VVWVDADCCAASASAADGHGHDLAVLLAFAAQAAQNLGTDAPFFVVGRDLRAAARLADRLAETGARNTYLITP
jgi:hypothetical protein